MELTETWQEAGSQRLLPSLCFSGRSQNPKRSPWPLICREISDFFSETAELNSLKLYMEQDLNVFYQVCAFRTERKQDGRPGLWLAETCSTSPLKPMHVIQRKLTGSKISTSFIKFVFFGPIGKTRWWPWPLIDWEFFYFSSTAEGYRTKLDRN